MNINIEKENLALQTNISNGIERIIKDVVKSTLKDPKGSAFMARFALSSRKAAKIRAKAEENGDHTPGFIIASVTSRCNLHCAGCYSRGIETTTDDTPSCQLSGDEWHRIFKEASALGISFALIAGGEPLLRKDIIRAAADVKDIMFPIFTNGTMIDDEYLDLFDDNRNLMPVLSIEGDCKKTDAVRGEGMYELITQKMELLKKRNILFGASITVTTENIREVMASDYVNDLIEKGCRAILFIEFVPISESSRHLAPGDEERKYIETEMTKLRSDLQDVLLLSFPGDELAMGGCMAAGREFFHINSHGGAEPCPFSPFSDINVKDSSLREALNSPLFRAIRQDGLLLEDHVGGCVLYEKREQVAALLR